MRKPLKKLNATITHLNMKIFSVSIFFVLLCLFFSTAHSQVKKENKTPLELFDQIVRIENTGLANGEEYIEPHIIRDNKHKYFLSSEFLNGQVFYDEQFYAPVSMKYNVFDDLLLVSLQTTVGTSTFKLHKEKVGSFKVEDHFFINIDTENDNTINGFHEVLLEHKEVILLKKHSKKMHKELDQNFTYYRFENDDAPKYVIFSNSIYSRVDSRRDIQKIFPDREKEIRSFYTSNSALRKSQPDQFMTGLLQYILN